MNLTEWLRKYADKPVNIPKNNPKVIKLYNTKSNSKLTKLDELERKLLLDPDLDEWSNLSKTRSGRVALWAVYFNS